MRWAATNNMRRASLTRLRDGVARQVRRGGCFLDAPRPPVDTAVRHERAPGKYAQSPLVVAPLLGVGPVAHVSYAGILGPISAINRGWVFLCVPGILATEEP
jgi:hypothetical protein